MFHAFSLYCLNGGITHTTGGLAYTTVQGKGLFKVLNQETCQCLFFVAPEAIGWCSSHIRIQSLSLLARVLLLPSLPATGTLLHSFISSAMVSAVPAGSTSHGGDVTVYVKDINQPSLPTPFILFLCLFLSTWPFQLYFIP